MVQVSVGGRPWCERQTCVVAPGAPVPFYSCPTGSKRSLPGAMLALHSGAAAAVCTSARPNPKPRRTAASRRLLRPFPQEQESSAAGFVVSEVYVRPCLCTAASLPIE